MNNHYENEGGNIENDDNSDIDKRSKIIPPLIMEKNIYGDVCIFWDADMTLYALTDTLFDEVYCQK